MVESDLYLSRGVSSSKSDVHKAIANVDKGLFPGAFCKILPDTLTGSEDHCILMHADGAGTKSSLAYLYWQETGDISVFKDIAIDSLVMNLDDLACVGAVDQFLLSNTIGRNKFFVSGEVISTIIQGYEEVIAMLNSHGVDIKSAGGETADVGDVVRSVIIDSTLVARMKREDVIDLDNIKPGNVILGFSSFGQAKWEKKYNSGIGSNGLTAARHDLFRKDYADKYPESFSPEIPKDLVYCGKSWLTDPLPGTPLTVGEAALSPTRTYTPLIAKLLAEFQASIHGMVHCSGGGQTKCLNFGKNIHYVKDNLFTIPPFFQFIQKQTKRPLKDLFPVYNMGHRLEIFCDEQHVPEMIAIAKDMGVEAQKVGYCEASSSTGNQLTIKYEGETIRYWDND